LLKFAASDLKEPNERRSCPWAVPDWALTWEIAEMITTTRKTEEVSDETIDTLLTHHKPPEENFGEALLFKRLQ
jgi:hypothetical protein